MNNRLAWALLSSTALLTGCANDMSDLEKYVADQESVEAKTIDPLPDITQVEPFLYEAGQRRDPFSIPEAPPEQTNAVSSSGVPPPDRNRRKEELEQFALDSLRMVGTLDIDNTMWALLLTTDGTLFKVKAGNYVGQNNGQINNITENRIEVTEIIPDSSGGWQERSSPISLTDPNSGTP